MKYLLTLLFTLIINAQDGNGQCEHSYVSNIGALRTELLYNVEAKIECSEYYQKLLLLIEASSDGDKSRADSIYLYGRDGLSIDQLNEFTYTYANVQRVLGYTSLSHYYYTYIFNWTPRGSYLNRLAKIDLLRKNLAEYDINEVKNNAIVWVKSGNLTSDQEVDIAIRINELLSFKDKREIYELVHSSVQEATNETLKAHFAALLAYYKTDSNSPEKQVYLERAIKSLQSEKIDNSEFRRMILEIERLNDGGKYIEALEIAKSVLQKRFGTSEMNVNRIDSIYRVSDFDRTLMVKYAHTSLYQTRVGGGLDNVERGYQIFQRVAENDLIQRLEIAEDLLASNRSNIEGHYLNQFIIGVYLYQQTDDLSYLEKSLSILDAAIAGGLTSQLALNERRRLDAGLDARINAINETAAELSTIGVKLPLEEVIEKATWLQQEREAVFTSRTEDELYAQLDLEELQRTMAQDSAASVGFYEIDGLAYRLYVSADTIEVSYQGDLPRIVAALSDSVAAAATSMTGVSANETGAASYELYSALFNGLTEQLPERLYIVATGSVEGVPFNVLRKDSLSSHPRYLGLEHAIARQFSLGNMLRLTSRPARADYPQPLALAPDFPGGPDSKNWLAEVMRGGEDEVTLPPLTYNTVELDYLKGLSTGRYLSGKSATAENYLAYAQRYGILHLATHAVSNEHDGIASRVYLLNKSGEAEAIDARTISNQLLSADLVTLSACETSRGGRNTLEGTIGLTRAYIAAGARSVVASNWSVEDRATAELMAGFYERTTAGEPPHIALQQARRAFVAKHPETHPSRWAAFEVFGGTSPISWVRTTAWYRRTSTWLAVAAVALLGVVGLFIYKRNADAQLAR